jgi:monoamine oxidase
MEEKGRKTTSFSRRDFLRAGAAVSGAAMLGGGTALAADAAVVAQPKPGPGGFDADVIVVGAGFSGMIAAHQVSKAGYSAIVVDALDRVGGRSWSTTLSDGTFFDIGAGWVSTRSGEIQALIQEFGLQTYFTVGRLPSDGQSILVGLDGTVTPYSGLPPLSAEALLEVGVAVETIDSLGKKVPVGAPWKAPRAEEFDAISAGSFFQELTDNPEALAFLTKQITGICALDPFAISLLQILALSHSVDGLANYGQSPGGANEQRIVGGTQQIPLQIAQRLGPGRVLLNSPVRDIEQDDRGVTVRTESATVHGRRAILAIATWARNFIRFNPPLPPDSAQLAQRYPLGTVLKLQLIYDRAFWRDAGLNGNSFAINEAFITQTVDGGGPLGVNEPGVLAGFPDDDAARKMGRMTPDQRRDLFIREMIPRFGSQARDLAKTVTPNYSELIAEDFEFIRGDYGGQPGPRVLTAFGFGPALREPVGRIHWAGTDTSTRIYGSLGGAAQAGKRAANEVIKAGLH